MANSELIVQEGFVEERALAAIEDYDGEPNDITAVVDFMQTQVATLPLT